MSLQFVIGRAGAGKSYILYKNMTEAAGQMSCRQFVALVPEQYSMEAQKEILDIHEKHAGFNIEVTSFIRLAYSVFEEQGVSGHTVMDDLSKTLVMRRVLESCKKDLVIYKQKTGMQGFTEKMNMVISEFKQYNISTPVIEEMICCSKNRPSLNHKLKDIKVIYDAFNQYINEKMITVEDVLDIFCRYIPTSEMIKNTYFYIDGFTGFTPIQYRVLELLIKFAAGVKVAVILPQDQLHYKDYSRYELFGLSKETLSKLENIAKENGIAIEKPIIAGEGQTPYRIRDNKELTFIEQNIFRKNNVYKGQCNAVEIYKCSNPHQEALFVAKKISSLVSEQEYRYKDLAVITGDMEGYYRYLEEEFANYDIPSFIDHKRDISSNPFVECIKAAIEVVEKDFSYGSVFHMLRLGIFDIAREDIDIMENYVLQSGRRGYKSYTSEWKKLYKEFEEEDLNIINNCREKIVNVMKSLRSSLKDSNGTVKDYTKSLYEFIVSGNMQEKIYTYAQKFQLEGNLSQSEEYKQAYSAIISMLDKLVELMGDDKISVAEYKQILQAGFESIKVGIIPPGLDIVMVGDVERTRLKDTKKIIFLIGVNEGIIPNNNSVNGVITDTDREFLENNRFYIAPTAKDNVFKQRLYLYSLLAKPTEKIYMSYSSTGSDGTARRKSYLISTMEKMFGNIVVADEEQLEKEELPITKKAALRWIAKNMTQYVFDKDSSNLYQIASILMKEAKYTDKIKLIVDGAFLKEKTAELDSDIAHSLYGTKSNIGITRLERYAACAYSQFLRNGLKLGERKKYEIAAFDIGNLYHDAINQYFLQVQKKNIDWGSMDKMTSDSIIDECVEKVIAEYDNDAIEGSARNLFIKSQVKETAAKTAEVLVKHIQSGSFRPAEYELKVTHGRIDRVDVLREDNKIYVKVIDYKSGNKKFSVEDTLLGLQMQLMVYLKDAMQYEAEKNPGCEVIPAGGFYFHVHNPYIKKPDYAKVIDDYRKKNPQSHISDDEIKIKAIKKQQYGEYRMSGMVNSDDNVLRWMDENLFEKTGKSDILPVGTTKSGLSATSVVMNGEDYNHFIDEVSKKAEDMKEEILSGRIDINPVEGACTYCPYMGICGYKE